MKSPIRQGDKLENGGEVTGGSTTTTFMGLPLAREGDGAVCVIHGETAIAEGNANFPDQDGKYAAMHLHQCMCGCKVISSLLNVHIR
ncbi:PAAR domain-containing protein [Paraburkholderia phymatum]|uniref:PAAR domain-containing protein n=1 Tax=Paraburkholderia phymatum TaxID=148447 RepID=A0ACC6UDD4_9BURK